jgi:hypothetical protein
MLDIFQGEASANLARGTHSPRIRTKSPMIARFSTAAGELRQPTGDWVIGHSSWKSSSFHTEKLDENYRNAIGEKHGRKDRR